MSEIWTEVFCNQLPIIMRQLGVLVVRMFACCSGDLDFESFDPRVGNPSGKPQPDIIQMSIMFDIFLVHLSVMGMMRVAAAVVGTMPNG